MNASAPLIGHKRTASWVVALAGLVLVACSGSDADTGGQAGGPAAAGAGAGGSAGRGGSQGTAGTAGTTSLAGSNSGGSLATGGTAPATGGASGSTASGGAANGGASGAASGAGGSPEAGSGNGSNAGGSGGVSGGSGGSGGTPAGGSCATGAWPEADPAVAGPFETVTEMNVGPTAGEGEDGEPVAFTLFRPADLGESGRCHPVVTWGNGTGSSPSLYGVFLRHLASHGFVVIASDSPNVARGNPQPMVAGVTWLVEQNADPASPFYGRIDTAHVGATGHSQGGLATTNAAGDSQITTMAPLCGAGQQRNLHGSAFFFCGEEDTVATCAGIQNAFNAVTDQPAMFANYLTADHANWVTFRGTTPSPVEVTITAWMRVELMGDTALRSWFYGPSCGLCTDEAWEVLQKNLDE